jgi:ABC-type phosphate/phosphonate transport system substrate-binding protein
MFRTTGDTIEFDGQSVAVWRHDISPTLRERLQDFLEGLDPDDLDEIEELRDALNTAVENLDEATNQRDAYAKLLGIKSDG